MKARGVTAGLLLLLAICPWPGSTASAGQIAFQTRRDGQAEIYAMNLDGSCQTNLTRHSSRDIHPAWSPDGTRIAFASDRKGTLQISVMDADGGNPVQLTRGPGDRITPAWSADGTQIAYASSELGTWDICVMQADGSEAINLTQSPSQDLWPTWSPDGTRIAFHSNRDRRGAFPRDVDPDGKMGWGPSDLFIMDSLGGAATNLTARFSWGINMQPVWSPDGTRILSLTGNITFDSHDLNYVVPQVWSLDPELGERYAVDIGIGNLEAPKWSPDGQQVVFAAADDRMDAMQEDHFSIGYDYEIYVIPTSGGGRKVAVNLTQTRGCDSFPTWSPDWVPPLAGTSIESTTWGSLKAQSARLRQSGAKKD
ncbi:MAG: hypothetical protein WDA75_13095 [Candidatus Latescibacterota bacterium]|jgi:Tol biopolymer transport system component